MPDNFHFVCNLCNVTNYTSTHLVSPEVTTFPAWIDGQISTTDMIKVIRMQDFLRKIVDKLAVLFGNTYENKKGFNSVKLLPLL